MRHLIAIILGCLVAPAAAQDWDRTKSLHPQLLAHIEKNRAARFDIGILVQPGTKDEADKYYERISGVLKFAFVQSTLETLVAHLGYSAPTVEEGRIVFKGLTAKDLEELPSFTLMPRNNAEFTELSTRVADPAAFNALLSLADFQNDNVLVSRFFAPKIATYYNAVNGVDEFAPIDPDAIVPGWRKVIKLVPRSGSQAAIDGQISHAYILFNFKEKAGPDVDPFVGNESGNNQVIIVPKNPLAGDRVFFAVYKSKSLAYGIEFFLQADFDLPGHVGRFLSGAQDSKYFVPRSCAECHGHSLRIGEEQPLKGQPVDPQSGRPTNDFSTGIYKFAKPNYLDTDQWYDWKDFDYRGVSGSLNDVVFDGGRDHSSANYARALDVIRKLNTGIANESLAAELDPNVPSFATLGAQKWLELHQTTDLRRPYSVRSIGKSAWNEQNPDEMKLLRLLNNHCFRCHSSLRYSVFDKDAVAARKGDIVTFLNLQLKDSNDNLLPGNLMPQGRVLSARDKTEIERLLKLVFP